MPVIILMIFFLTQNAFLLYVEYPQTIILHNMMEWK
jgi:hypothetical protein